MIEEEGKLVVDQRELAAVLGLSTRQVRRLTAGGMPSIRSGRKRLYDLRRAVAWCVAHRSAKAASSSSPARTRKLFAEARLAELDVAEREAELIPVAVHERVTAEVLGRVREGVEALPLSLAPKLVGLESPREAVAVMRDGANECLESLVALADELDGEPEAKVGADPPADDNGAR